MEVNFSRSGKNPWVDRVDQVVADFTKNILGMARKRGVDFSYAGSGGDRPAEIKRTLRIDVETAKKLMEVK